MTSSKGALSKIEHIVVIMLENRSFDNMLGFLYSARGNVSPLGHPFEGLTGKETNPDKNGKPVRVFPIKKEDPNSYFMPRADPGEGFKNTNSQLFGTTSPKPGALATNKGFVTNFDYTLGWESEQQGRVIPGTQVTDIMGIYTPEMLPVLSRLAEGYAVCDHWYASAPTETIPNRAFSAMATSQGQLTDDTKVYTAPSIFSLLSKKGCSWAAYGYDAPPLMQQTIADITHAPASNFGEFTDFQAAVKKGTLANYVFLEPQWGTSGNSEHPNYDVSKGEQFLHQLYYTLYGSAVWEKTLFIITYDEHGGCYDHVAPPTNATTPDNSVGQFGFDFKRFGVRVPTILISPLIEAGTVYRAPSSTDGGTPFDHTSILATIEARWGLPNLTARDKAAPHIGGVLTLKKARKDDPLEGVTPPSSGASAPLTSAPSHLEQALAESVAALPLADKAGHRHDHQKPTFSTGAEALDYARRRYSEYHKRRKQAEKK